MPAFRAIWDRSIEILSADPPPYDLPFVIVGFGFILGFVAIFRPFILYGWPSRKALNSHPLPPPRRRDG